MQPSTRPALASVPMDPVTLDGAIERVLGLVRAGEGGTVFTPNADHIVVANEDADFYRAYQEVSLSLVDGTPVFWMARILGLGLPEKVSGSDLFEPLVGALARAGHSVFLLGGGEGVAELAAAKLTAQFPGLQVAGLGSPRMDARGVLVDEAAWLSRIERSGARVVFVACGAPKSELFSARVRRVLGSVVFVCVGAAIDFTAGTAKRAPRIFSIIGLEWAYRLAQEPRRLAKRYLLRDPKFFLLAFRDFFGRRVP